MAKKFFTSFDIGEVNNLINDVTSTPQRKYQDPLNKNGIVLLSYSNEVGTAIAEIAPKLGAALWAPTFMYLGADIYDKYKNDKDNYDPSAKRAFKRAIYQGLTSLIALPAVIYACQNAISPFGKFGKHKISTNTQEAVYRHTKDIVTQTHGYTYKDYEAFKSAITEALENKIHTRTLELKKMNPLKKLYLKVFTDRYYILNAPKEKIIKFAEQNAEKTYEILQNLKNGNTDKVPPKIYKEYKKTLPIVKESYKNGDYSHLASRAALKKYQASLIFKNKLLKTIAGLTSIVLFAKPINDCVEKYIMKKYVNQGIDTFSDKVRNVHFTKPSKLHTIIKGQS